MLHTPLYLKDHVRPAYELRYSWAGWPSSPLPIRSESVLADLQPWWEDDGLRLLEHRWCMELLQLTFSARPDVSPIFLAGRAKGRLQHALRKVVPDFGGFRRKVSVHSVGHNCREDVEAYVAAQVETATFVDARFRDMLQEFTTTRPEVDLAQPTESSHGRYWYNLHLVLVTDDRQRFVDPRSLSALHAGSLRIADKKGYKISRLSVMPDHLHVALRGNIEQSPGEIALAFQNNLAYAMGQVAIWAPSYYTGTFGEYDMWAIRGR